MQKIYDHLFIGSDNDCLNSSSEHAVIHACKTCHKKYLGYQNSLDNTHPNYLIAEKEKNLYLNLVDMEKEFSAQYTDPIMQRAMVFIDQHIKNQSLLVHCNQGRSRAPSIALLYLAKEKIISDQSYYEAQDEFKKQYGDFNPGNGIALYMNKNWNNLLKLVR